MCVNEVLVVRTTKHHWEIKRLQMVPRRGLLPYVYTMLRVTSKYHTEYEVQNSGE